MGFDGLFVRALTLELRSLIGLRVDKINQPQRGAFVFSFRGKNLLISVESNAAYLAMTKKKWDNPLSPPAFCMLLRKYLLNSTLLDIRQEGVDRTIYFVFSSVSSTFEKTERTLVVEAMGRHANLLLLDEDQKIIDCIKRSALDARQALPGLTYTPFSDTRKNILEEDLSKLDEDTNFLKEYQGFSKLSATYASSFPENVDTLVNPSQNQPSQLDDSSPTESSWEGSNNLKCPETSALRGYTCENEDGIKDFYFIKDALALYHDGLTIKEYPTLSEAASAFYMRSLSKVNLKRVSEGLGKTIKSRIAKLNGKLGKQRMELEATKKASHFKKCGDLILSNATIIEEGSSRAVLTDYEQFIESENDFAKIEVNLDTQLSATDNAEKYYKKYKKALSAKTFIAKQIKQTESDIKYLEETAVLLENSETEAEVKAIMEELENAGFIKRHKKNEKRKKSGKNKKTTAKQGVTLNNLNVHHFKLSSGKQLLVGRSNLANDELTMKYASNSDTWLHTNSLPGSHCIIRNEGTEPSDQDLLEASQIAAYYSKARNSSKVPVDYCLVKYVKKIPHAKPGMVTYDNFKTVIVDPLVNIKKEK